LRIDDGASDRAEEGLGMSGSGRGQEGQEQDPEDPCSHHLLLDKRPITARTKGGRRHS
jgi:hypothetical protein